MSPPMERQARDAPTVSCSLVAVDLTARRHLFTQPVATRGLLNVVSAPHMSLASTYIAQYTDGGGAQHANPRAPGAGAAHDVRAPDEQLHRSALQAAGVDGGDGEVGEVGLEGGGRWSDAWLKRALDETDIAGAALTRARCTRDDVFASLARRACGLAERTELRL